MSLPQKTGVLIVNLGTPLGTNLRNIRRYLTEFLTDKRVVETHPFLWYPILYGIILNFRPRSLRKKYQRIWHVKNNESPLRAYTRAQAEKLNTSFAKGNILVEWAMRYGSPSIEQGVNHLLQQNCTEILLLPLYPQYSATTTSSVLDAFFSALKKRRFIPPFSIISSYAKDPTYIDALAESIKKHFNKLGYVPEHLMVAFHGIPKKYVACGDPYLKQCEDTFYALRQKIDLKPEQISLTFQSRFGKEEWLQPYMDKSIAALARQGVRSLAVINPGFASDCLETLDEIGHEAAEIFYENGGKNFSRIPCLNDSDLAISLYQNLINAALQPRNPF